MKIILFIALAIIYFYNLYFNIVNYSWIEEETKAAFEKLSFLITSKEVNILEGSYIIKSLNDNLVNSINFRNILLFLTGLFFIFNEDIALLFCVNEFLIFSVSTRWNYNNIVYLIIKSLILIISILLVRVKTNAINFKLKNN